MTKLKPKKQQEYIKYGNRINQESIHIEMIKREIKITMKEHEKYIHFYKETTT